MHLVNGKCNHACCITITADLITNSTLVHSSDYSVIACSPTKGYVLIFLNKYDCIWTIGAYLTNKAFASFMTLKSDADCFSSAKDISFSFTFLNTASWKFSSRFCSASK